MDQRGRSRKRSARPRVRADGRTRQGQAPRHARAASRRATPKLSTTVVVRRAIGLLVAAVLGVVLTLAGVLFLMMRGPSPSARNVTVTTFLESGALKFVPHLFLGSAEIEDIVNNTAMEDMDTSVLDSSLIDTDQKKGHELGLDEITIEEISGRSYFAKMMIVNDPSRVRVGTTYPFTENGSNLDEIVKAEGAIAGVNGGLYDNINGNGGMPRGEVVSDGVVEWIATFEQGIYLVGLDEDNVLQIISMDGLDEGGVRDTIEEYHIRDAVSFQEEASDTNNHFCPLIINGKPRELNGMGSGCNPRTAIGQRADGAILLLVTDGRGAQGHLGATASDLIDIMLDYGAVNAANLDGGSSSSMYYEGAYEMTSVTLYYANSSWLMPTAVVVDGV